MTRDPNLVSGFADLQACPSSLRIYFLLSDSYLPCLVKLFAEFATPRLMGFLRASNYWKRYAIRWLLSFLLSLKGSLLQAYNVCKERDLVTEMAFLLGRMGDNKKHSRSSSNVWVTRVAINPLTGIECI